MHQISENSSFSIGEITKVEGSASLDVEIKKGKVKSVKFKIQEYKRFYTKAMQGKPVAAVPQLLSRICGTCSNAHLMASIEAVEHTLGITPSEQTRILRALTYHGLIIRDHALHLYMFSMPDIFKKDSLLQFDDNDPQQHQLLHDAFTVKGAGNQLAILVAGRSVHAPYPLPGGFSRMPDEHNTPIIIEQLKKARPAVLRLIDVFLKCGFEMVRETNYVALKTKKFSYLEGDLYDMDGFVCGEKDFRDHLEHVVIPYSQASGYVFKGKPYRIGAIARLNVNKDTLHPNTKKDASEAIAQFPSHNIYHNNLAQAIEVLHSIDDALEILEHVKFVEEKPIKITPKAGVGVGVVEAPRGTLYHKLELDKDGKVKKGEVIVPTGQNQISIEDDLKHFIENNLGMDQEDMAFECEKIIRAYDPCMSCASHFLKLRMKEV
jgi:sulfhydrogenase subunit alpha